MLTYRICTTTFEPDCVTHFVNGLAASLSLSLCRGMGPTDATPSSRTINYEVLFHSADCFPSGRPGQEW